MDDLRGWEKVNYLIDFNRDRISKETGFQNV